MLYTIIIGAVIGWIAGQLMKGKGFGFIGNIFVGIIGSAIGDWLSRQTGIAISGDPLISTIVTGVVGAVALLFVINLIKK